MGRKDLSGNEISMVYEQVLCFAIMISELLSVVAVIYGSCFCGNVFVAVKDRRENPMWCTIMTVDMGLIAKMSPVVE